MRTNMAQRINPAQEAKTGRPRPLEKAPLRGFLPVCGRVLRPNGKSYSLGTESGGRKVPRSTPLFTLRRWIMHECLPARVKDFASLRQPSGLPSCHTREPNNLARAPDTREGARERGQGLPLSLQIGDSRTSSETDTRSVGRSVGWGRKAHSSAGTLLTPQRRHVRGTPGS